MMITLKAALVGASCVGALAIGGVTYATVAQPDPGLRSDRGKLPQSVPAASQHPVKPAPVPGDNCLPNKLPKDVKPADPAKPNVPNLPPLKKVDCDTVKPAIALGGPAEK